MEVKLPCVGCLVHSDLIQELSGAGNSESCRILVMSAHVHTM